MFLNVCGAELPLHFPLPSCCCAAAVVKMGSKDESDQILQMHQLDPYHFNLLPKLKQNAMQEW